MWLISVFLQTHIFDAFPQIQLCFIFLCLSHQLLPLLLRYVKLRICGPDSACGTIIRCPWDDFRFSNNTGLVLYCPQRWYYKHKQSTAMSRAVKTAEHLWCPSSWQAHQQPGPLPQEQSQKRAVNCFQEVGYRFLEVPSQPTSILMFGFWNTSAHYWLKMRILALLGFACQWCACIPQHKSSSGSNFEDQGWIQPHLCFDQCSRFCVIASIGV